MMRGDFVEVPSQLFEEWAWDERVLAGFAHHHETGEPIPGELVRRLRAAEPIRMAAQSTRAVGSGPPRSRPIARLGYTAATYLVTSISTS